MKKRILAIVLALTMLFTFAACGSGTTTSLNQQYTINGTKVTGFYGTNVTYLAELTVKNNLAVPVFGTFSDSALGYVYSVPASSATTLVENYYKNVLSQSAGFLNQYFDIEKLLEAIPGLSEQLSKANLGSFKGIINLNYYYNPTAKNLFMIGTVTVGSTTFVLVVPDVLNATTALNPLLNWFKDVQANINKN